MTAPIDTVEFYIYHSKSRYRFLKMHIIVLEHGREFRDAVYQ